MNSSVKTPETSRPFRQVLLDRIDRLRIRIGASRGQFATLCLLLIIGATVIARPAGMLLWHRLRIITGMPRMAVANQDPTQVALADPLPNRLDPGRPVVLDDFLVRDPFRAPLPAVSDNAAFIASLDKPVPNGGVVIEIDLDSARIVEAASLIRLTGTAKGLGTALLDGSVRRVGDSIESGSLVFILRKVRSSEVLLEFSADDGTTTTEIVLDRAGAQLVAGR